MKEVVNIVTNRNLQDTTSQIFVDKNFKKISKACRLSFYIKIFIDTHLIFKFIQGQVSSVITCLSEDVVVIIMIGYYVN